MTRRSEGRPKSSRLYPWYDSIWLTKYATALDIVRRVRPKAAFDFIQAFGPFRTRPDFEATLVERPFDEDTLAVIRATVALLRPTELELHEAAEFGRFVVHDHPYFTELQERTTPMVSTVVGEPVDVAYNFLSLYTAKGVCAVHMDAPEAKWTLDLCIDQSAPWPIHFSQVLPWPDSGADTWGNDWEEKIKRSPKHRFSAHALEPGQAVIFSGSSQFHYRDAMPQTGGLTFCNLLFFHYIPRGTSELVQPENWARLFGIPELSQVA